MAASYYELYKPVPERYPKRIRQALLYRPYKELQRHNISVRVRDYRMVKKEVLNGSETVREIRERLEKAADRSSIHNTGSVLDRTERKLLQVGDVIATTKDGLTLAYYVDPNRLILLPEFFGQPSSAALISIDTAGYMIDGRKGSWMAADSAMIDGKLYYLMLSENYGRKAPYVVIDDHGTVMTTDNLGFTDDCISRIRETERQLELKRQTDRAVIGMGGSPHLENWQKRYENGEYLRTAEMSSEQNYNMIDGFINNTAVEGDGKRRSVLERLSEKKGSITPSDKPPGPENRSIEIETANAQRSRK